MVAAHQKPVEAIAVSPKGDRVLSVSYDNTAKLWEWADGGELRLMHHVDGVTGGTTSCTAAFSPDGATAYAGRGECKLIDVSSGRTTDLPSALAGAEAAGFLPDGKLLALARTHEGVALVDPASGRVREVLPADAYGLAFSPDGRLLFSGNEGGKVTAWDAKLIWPIAAPWTSELATAAAHEGRVWAVAVSPDGKTLATGADDRTIVLWDLLVAVPDGRQP
jgi:WD40 repeat protein